MGETAQEMNILLMEGNPGEAELATRSLKKCKPANKFVWVKDGADVLGLIFAAEVTSSASTVLSASWWSLMGSPRRPRVGVILAAERHPAGVTSITKRQMRGMIVRRSNPYGTA